MIIALSIIASIASAEPPKLFELHDTFWESGSYYYYIHPQATYSWPKNYPSDPKLRTWKDQRLTGYPVKRFFTTGKAPQVWTLGEDSTLDVLLWDPDVSRQKERNVAQSRFGLRPKWTRVSVDSLVHTEIPDFPELKKKIATSCPSRRITNPQRLLKDQRLSVSHHAADASAGKPVQQIPSPVNDARRDIPPPPSMPVPPPPLAQDSYIERPPPPSAPPVVNRKRESLNFITVFEPSENFSKDFKGRMFFITKAQEIISITNEEYPDWEMYQYTPEGSPHPKVWYWHDDSKIDLTDTEVIKVKDREDINLLQHVLSVLEETDSITVFYPDEMNSNLGRISRVTEDFVTELHEGRDWEVYKSGNTGKLWYWLDEQNYIADGSKVIKVTKEADIELIQKLLKFL